MQTAEASGNVLQLVHQIRSDHPTMSCRAMYYKLRPLPLGRDNFEQLCKAHGYGREPLKSSQRTTNSNGVVRFDNLLASLTLTAPNQAWSSDITYFEIRKKFYYITFILDCYSRVILGYKASTKLETADTTLPALLMAIETRKGVIPKGLVLHSDGGGQYYAKVFLKLTDKHHMKNSMCEFAYENGKAERINGIIKNNYLKFYKIESFTALQKSLDRAVRLYNDEKPHKSLKYETPSEYEKKWILLQQQTKPTMTESLDAKPKCERASSPFTFKQTKPLTPDVFPQIHTSEGLIKRSI